jgi:hypothetical protein
VRESGRFWSKKHLVIPFDEFGDKCGSFMLTNHKRVVRLCFFKKIKLFASGRSHAPSLTVNELSICRKMKNSIGFDFNMIRDMYTYFLTEGASSIA